MSGNTHFCGLCCTKPQACDDCIHVMLRANELADTEVNFQRLRAIPNAEHGRYGHMNNYTWALMAMCREATEVTP